MNRGWCAPIDPDTVAADEHLIEQIRSGATPTDPVGRTLAAWRDEARR